MNPNIKKDLTIKEISLIIAQPEYQNFRPLLLELIKKSKKKTMDNLSFFRLQETVAKEIIQLESQIRSLKSQSDRQKRNKAWLMRKALKTQRHLIKEVMDASAWRMLDFNRPVLRQLAEHNQTGHLSPGFSQEIKIAWKITSKTNNFVILNDLTNFLRYGDLTIITPDKNTIQEVKTTQAVSGKQKKNLNRLIEMLNNKKLMIGEKEANLIDAPIKPIHFFDKVNHIIEKALDKDDGVYAERIAPYIWTCCFIPLHIYNYRKKNCSMPTMPKPPFDPDDVFIPFNTLYSVPSTFIPNLAPISIFPLNNEYITDIVMGNIQLHSIVSRKFLKKSFKGKGWELNLPSTKSMLSLRDPSNMGKTIENIRNPQFYPFLQKGNFTYKIPLEIFLKMAGEFASVKTLVETAEFLMSNSEKKRETPFAINYMGEGEIWN